MIELQELEEQAAVEDKASLDKTAHDESMLDANLDGVETLLDAMIREDPEWERFTQVWSGFTQMFVPAWTRCPCAVCCSLFYSPSFWTRAPFAPISLARPISSHPALIRSPA